MFFTGNSNATMHYEDFTLDRDVVKLGDEVKYGVRVVLDEDMPRGTRTHFGLTRDLTMVPEYPVYVKIRCLNGQGSCSYDTCEAVEDEESGMCHFMSASNQRCQCPMKAGVYEAYDMTYKIPTRHEAGALFSKGNYRFEYRHIAPDGRELGCLTIDKIFITFDKA